MSFRTLARQKLQVGGLVVDLYETDDSEIVFLRLHDALSLVKAVYPEHYASKDAQRKAGTKLKQYAAALYVTASVAVMGEEEDLVELVALQGAITFFDLGPKAVSELQTQFSLRAQQVREVYGQLADNVAVSPPEGGGGGKNVAKAALGGDGADGSQCPFIMIDKKNT